MTTNFEKVGEFHKTYQCEMHNELTLPSEALKKLRLALIEEEYVEELQPALEADDMVEVADALTDLLYVVYGAGHAFGIDLDKCFEEVHRSNMSKLDEDGNPIFREDGKVLKGPNFFEPDLKTIIGVQNDT